MTTSYISRTGRVQSWLDDPTSRLPVSCTVFTVEDSIEGDNGIEASWKFVSHCVSAQGAQFTFPNCDQRELKTKRG